MALTQLKGTKYEDVFFKKTLTQKENRELKRMYNSDTDQDIYWNLAEQEIKKHYPDYLHENIEARKEKLNDKVR